MIAGQHDAIGTQQRNPAARLGALAGLVDDRQIEAACPEQFVVEPGRGRAENVGRIENLLDRLRFQPARIGQQRLGFGRISRRAPGSGLALVVRAAWRNRAKASLTSLRASRTSSWRSTSRSSVCVRNSGITRAGCPSRTTRSPCASSRSKRLSTARLLGAQASTFSPRRTAWRISSTTVVVLPVPGGP